MVAAALLATSCAGLFAGAALYISLVQQPAILTLGAPIAVRYFAPMYAGAAPLQASLALVGSVAGAVAWWSSGNRRWLAGALLLAAVIPLTLAVIAPVNEQLMQPALDPAAPDAARLLQQWARLHALRTLSSLLSFGVFLFAMLGRP